MVATFDFSSSACATRGVEFGSDAAPEDLAGTLLRSPQAQKVPLHSQRKERVRFIDVVGDQQWVHVWILSESALFSLYNVSHGLLQANCDNFGVRTHRSPSRSLLMCSKTPFVLHDKRISSQRTFSRIRLYKKGGKAPFHPSLIFPDAFIYTMCSFQTAVSYDGLLEQKHPSIPPLSCSVMLNHASETNRKHKRGIFIPARVLLLAYSLAFCWFLSFTKNTTVFLINPNLF